LSSDFHRTARRQLRVRSSGRGIASSVFARSTHERYDQQLDRQGDFHYGLVHCGFPFVSGAKLAYVQ